MASVLALGVSDHLQCAIKGHNYPDIANPPEQLRQKLGPQYAGLLEVVQQKLPGSKFWKRTSARFRAARGSTCISSREGGARFSP